MKVVKTIVIVLVAVAAIAFISSLFMPEKKLVEKSLLIKAPADAVYAQVNDLRNWRNWSPWYKMDTTQVLVFSDNPVGNNAWYTWKSNNKDIGAGKLTITDSKTNEVINVLLEMEEWGNSTAYYKFVTTDSGILVTQGMELDSKGTPWGKWMNTMMGGMLSKTFDDGLKDMKIAAESTPASTGPEMVSRVEEVRDTTTGEFFYISIKDSCAADAIGPKIQELMTELAVNVAKQDLKQVGDHYAVYHSYDPTGVVVLEAAIPVNKLGKKEGRINSGKMPVTKAIYVRHFGDYAATGNAHNAIDANLKASGKTVVGAPWEVYPDPSKAEKKDVLTIVYYPVS